MRWSSVLDWKVTFGLGTIVTLVVETEGSVQVGLSGWAVNVKIIVPDSSGSDT